MLDFPVIDRFFVIYHYITSFLRIGDVSLIDLESFRLSGLGEIKAGPVKDGNVQGFLGIISNSPLPLAQANKEAASGEKYRELVRSPERFERQLKRMASAVKISVPDQLIHARFSVDNSIFKDTIEEVRSQGIWIKRWGASLLLVAINSPRDSRTGSRSTQNPEEHLAPFMTKLSEQVQQLFTGPSEDNDLWISPFFLGHHPGAIPKFWSGMPIKLFKALFREQVSLITIYNPAQFIRHLRTFDLELQFLPEKKPCIARKTADKELRLENASYFLALIQNHLADEAEVASYINDLFSMCSDHPDGATIDFVPMHRSSSFG